MKNVILILGIITTFMVYGVVAGPSLNAAPVIYMELTEEQCRICHSDANVLRNINHDAKHPIGLQDPLDCIVPGCHIQSEPRKLDCMNPSCHEYPVIDHHDFDEIFEGDEWDCLICHEKGVPRPFDD